MDGARNPQNEGQLCRQFDALEAWFSAWDLIFLTEDMKAVQKWHTDQPIIAQRREAKHPSVLPVRSAPLTAWDEPLRDPPIPPSILDAFS